MLPVVGASLGGGVSLAGNKRKEPSTPVPVQDPGDVMRVTPLGAGQEVGRSCLLLEYKGKTIMLDCGLHPANSGFSALPFLDEVDPSTVDVLLISHFHVDHAAGLPYFMEKTTFKGRVFMTHPTKAIYKWLLSDYVKISNLSAEDQLYDEQDLQRSYEKIEVVDYHQEMDVEGIKFTPYNAGHVLGAAMFLIEIAGVRVLYTGDYSREEDRHLMAAERPPNVTPEVLICESTYGVQSHEPRVEREARFTRMVHNVVQRGGRCLLPVFALGRAQELLLILDEYWQAHAELHNVPIYYASSLAKKCMTVFQTYTNMMNARIRQQVKISNPFQFKHISNLKSMAHFDDVGPCVMMASPGMLQNGLSRELFELWCVDARNGVIIPGYVVEGTLGKQILSQPEEVQSMSGAKLPLRLSVEYISFSAHVDYRENSAFIEDVGAPNLILVHGDSNAMGRLRSALQSKYAERDVQLHIHTPKNCETVELYFRGEKMAKTIGRLAKNPPQPSQLVSGVLVCRDFTYHLLDPEDLPEFTDLTPASITQRQSIPCRAPFGIVKWYLEMMYGPVELTGARSFRVFDVVKVTQSPNLRVYTLEWEGSAVNDMIADSIVAVILERAGTSPASVKLTNSSCSHSHGSQDGEEEDNAKIKELDDEGTPKPEPRDEDEDSQDTKDDQTNVDVRAKEGFEQGSHDTEAAESSPVLHLPELASSIEHATRIIYNQFGKGNVNTVVHDTSEPSHHGSWSLLSTAEDKSEVLGTRNSGQRQLTDATVSSADVGSGALVPLVADSTQHPTKSTDQLMWNVVSWTVSVDGEAVVAQVLASWYAAPAGNESGEEKLAQATQKKRVRCSVTVSKVPSPPAPSTTHAAQDDNPTTPKPTSPTKDVKPRLSLTRRASQHRSASSVASDELARRVLTVVQRAWRAVRPVGEMWAL